MRNILRIADMVCASMVGDLLTNTTLDYTSLWYNSSWQVFVLACGDVYEDFMTCECTTTFEMLLSWVQEILYNCTGKQFP